MASNESSTSNAAFSAYLKPLLKKHALGQLLTYDDLMQAWDAAVRRVRCPVDALVQKQIQELHDSQLQEYDKVARTALTEYAQTCALLGMSDSDTERSYVEKCLAALNLPDWKVADARQLVTDIVQQRATAAWQQKQSQDMMVLKQVVQQDDEDDGDNTDDDEEEGELSVAAGTTSTATSTSTATAKQKRGAKKTTTVKKKTPPATKLAATTTAVAPASTTVTTKALPRGGNKPGRGRARRGGRGGAAGKA